MNQYRISEKNIIKMLGPTVSDVAMLYSPTPMKRRSGKKSKSPRRLPKEVEGGEILPDHDCDDCSKTSKLGSTVGTVATATMGDSDSDSDCDARSFFSDTFSAISELPDPEGSLSPHRSDAESSPKKDKKKKKKKKGKPLKSPKTPKSSKKKKKKKKEKTPKSEKSKKKSVKKKKSEKSKKSSKDKKSKALTEDMFGESDDDSFLGDSFHGTRRVEPRMQQQEEESEDFPGGPPLWGETDEEKSHADEWVEDKSWNGWEGTDDKSEYVEETICDDLSHDGFSYYTIHSSEEMEMDLDMGFPDNEDIEDDDITELSEKSEVVDTKTASEKKRVTFNDCETVHDTLHIADFTKKEIKRSWYQQKDYEETIEGVKEVANNSETPRDTQTRLRRQRSLSSKTAETRGLEAWTPSGVQRFRYVKEAAFRAVWDEQQKHYSSGSYEDDESDISTVIENQEKLREAYERISQKSILEAQQRAKKDEEIAAKILPRSNKRGGHRGNWAKSMGSSSRSLLGSDHGLSDNPAFPPSCLRKEEDPTSPGLSFESGDSGRRQIWFGDSSPRCLVRGKSDCSISKADGGLFRAKSDRSERSIFKKPERGVFRQVSDRSLPSVFHKSKTPERGLFRQMSDRGAFKEQPERGLFRQISDRSLFKKNSSSGGLGSFLNKESSEHKRSIFSKNSDSRSVFSKNSGFGSIKEEPDPSKRKPKRRSSDLGLRRFNKENRGLSRSKSLRGM